MTETQVEIEGPSGHGLTPAYRTSCSPAGKRIHVKFNGVVVADSENVLEFRETRRVPTYYFPRRDVRMDLLERTDHTTHCLFKGNASYWSVRVGDRVAENAVWSYETPDEAALDLEDHVAFYDDKMDAWYEDGERVQEHAAEAESFRDNPLMDWLMREAWEAANSRELTRRLVQALGAADIPVRRMRIVIRTLHPLLAATAYNWSIGAAEVERFEISHDVLETGEFRDSPLMPIFEGAGGVRRSLTAQGEDDFPVLADLRAQGMTDYVAMPIAFSDGQINAITLATDVPDGFTTAALGHIHEVLPVLSRFYEVHAKRRNAMILMQTFLGKHTGERVLDGLVKRGDGENIHAVIWFCDLRGSTALADSMSRDEFLIHLNRFFDCMAGAVIDHGGEVLRFVGDAVLAIFPIADPERTERAGAASGLEACEEALEAARQAKQRLDVMNATARAGKRPRLDFGIGLHLGDVTYGNIGIPERLEFTVIGAAANEAARIEAMTKTLDQPILMSSEFAASCPGELLSLGMHELRGVGAEWELFTLPENED